MKFDGYKLVPFAKIIGPGDVAKRQRTAGVKALAASIKELGDEPMHAMVARKEAGAWELIAGRDRFSALLLLGAKQAWVHVVKQATELEEIKAEAHENLRRRADDPAKLLAQIDKAEQAILSERSTGKSKAAEPAMGRPKTARGEARELLAEASGRSPDALRSAETRAKVREEGAGRHGAQGDPATPLPVSGHETPAAPPIDLHGHALPGHMVDVASLVKQFDKVDRLLRQAQAAATELGIFGSMPPGVVEKVKREIHEAAVVVRAEAPSDLCPKCDGKSRPIVGPLCPLCQERGWLRKDAYQAAPKKGVSPNVEEFLSKLEHQASEHAAGLDPEPVRERKIPPIKAGITYTTDAAGDVVPQAAAPKKKRGPRVVIAGPNGDHEVTEEEARELTLERTDDDEAWA